MLFNSLPFLVFAVIFFCVWPLLRERPHPRWGLLVVASFIFYGWWDWRFLILIAFSGLVDFFAAGAMARRPQHRSRYLAMSLVGNVGSLAAFKYSTFLATTLDSAFGTAFAAGIPDFVTVVPVGISFYTFQSMSYTIDVYRGRLEPTRNVLHFFAYLSMFPQLVAGPIVRGRDLLPALAHPPRTSEADRFEGTCLVVQGMFKKVVIADHLAPAVNAAFDAGAPNPSTAYWWVVTSMFAFQIYCDFSGYSDIARGLARWMGYRFPLNFNHPYLATSMREFWNRWHISLSTWLRDYVYVPLGGSRCGAVRAHANMWVTMLVSGLWHGAAWTFVVWGAMHAAWLSLERWTRWPTRLGASVPARLVAALLVIVQVWLGWVVFRAESLAQAWRIIVTMVSETPGPLEVPVSALMALGLGVALELWRGVHDRLSGVLPPLARVPVDVRPYAPWVVACMAVACVYLRGPGAAFIYFQF
jgi:alginate O-acetyltransferase complex protein AlgI